MQRLNGHMLAVFVRHFQNRRYLVSEIFGSGSAISSKSKAARPKNGRPLQKHRHRMVLQIVVRVGPAGIVSAPRNRNIPAIDLHAENRTRRRLFLILFFPLFEIGGTVKSAEAALFPLHQFVKHCRSRNSFVSPASRRRVCYRHEENLNPPAGRRRHNANLKFGIRRI
jgi:hypothetical protein